jgi:predicted small metal-binding protein
MELIVRCACGWQTRGTEDQVIASAAEHGKLLHNMTATREQILAMAEPAN